MVETNSLSEELYLVFLWPLKLPSAMFPSHRRPSGCLPTSSRRQGPGESQLAWPESVLPLWGSSSLGSPSGHGRTNIQFF